LPEHVEQRSGNGAMELLFPLPLYRTAPAVGRLRPAKIESLAYERLRSFCVTEGLCTDTLPKPSDGIKCEDDEDDAENLDDMAADELAHFTLRLAFCATHALREWFVARELKLLERRWEKSSTESRREALAREELRPVVQSDDTVYCDVHFTALPPVLVAERRVILHNGIARVVGKAELGILIAQRFKARLREMLKMVAEMPTALDDHPSMHVVVSRLRECGEGLLTVYAPASLAADGGGGVGLTLQNFEVYLEQSFPPCMRHLVMHQRMGRHLKNQGRLQLRPFLREAGLNLDSALKWWQRELCRDPSVSSEEFSRSYKYEIEHTHGAQGHRRGTFCFSCKRILGFQMPIAGEARGCPFKVLSAAELAFCLPFWKVPASEVQAIISRAATDGPELACAAFFQATHPAQRDLELVHHPNEFLRRSRRIREEVSAHAPQEMPLAAHKVPSSSSAVAQTVATQEMLVGETPEPAICGRPVASPAREVPLANRQIPRRRPVNVALGPFSF